ncbi:MAG: hypothetical protein ACW99F_13410, partial [Candidatus Hodarchaeales archaeon]
EYTKGEPFCLIHLGDSIDGVHHGSVTQITHNIKDQKNIALQVLEPVIAKAEKYYHIRGTEAHVGKSSAHDEDVARQLNAIPDEQGNFARYELWLSMNKKLIHFSHHISGTGSSSYESTGVYRELVESFVQAGRFGDRPPDMIVRGHRHRYFKTEVGGRTSVVLPGWQLKTPYVYRIASGRASPPQIGAIVIRSGESDPLYTRSKVWHVQRPKEIKI